MNRRRRESTGQWFAALLLLAGTSLFAADPGVDSVSSFSQRPGTKLVDITYTVSDADNDDLTISVDGQDADGAVSMSTLSGDGASGTVKPGTHTLTWDAGADYAGGFDNGFQIELNASDSSGAPAPEGFVLVEAGTHNGTNWALDDEDLGPMSITISEPFHIGKYEVTNAQVASVMQWAYDNGKVNASSSTVTNATGDSQELLDLDDGDCQISFSDGTFSVDSGKDNCPCVDITWYGAAAYCNYLSESQGLTPAYNMTDASGGDYEHSDWTLNGGANGYRLPSEAQWEYAARGGKDGNDTEYSGSDTLDDVGWHWDNSGNHSHAVGTKATNELGAHDMSGNVWEWCHDWAPGNEGVARVYRGGSWGYNFADVCRVSGLSGRNWYGPVVSLNDIGFRLALPADAADTYDISGTVSGDVLEGVTITLSGDTTTTTTTDVGGNYSFSYLLNGAYTLTAEFGGYSFAPTEKSVTIDGNDINNVDFEATDDEGGGEVLLPEMVYVEAGATPGGDVTISEPFYIGKHEVTNAQVATVMQWAYDNGKVNASSSTVTNAAGDSQELLDLDDSHCQISFSDGTFSVDSGKDNYPCVEITWYGAAAYCNYLSESQGLAPPYNLSSWTLNGGAKGYRLPSDAQREYAARGGKDGNDTEYSGSSDINAVAWYNDNSGRVNHAVGTKAANELGTHNMSGNVWEWCHDWYPGLVGVNRVIRGGSWSDDPVYCRVSDRGRSHPDRSSADGGFRLFLPAGQ